MKFPDMVPSLDEDVVSDEGVVRDKRNAARDRKKLWGSRTIPYEYGEGLPSMKS